VIFWRSNLRLNKKRSFSKFWDVLISFNKYDQGSSITEGIGQGRLTDNLKGSPIDEALFIHDKEAVKATFRLLYEEGFFVGATSGLNVAAAMKVAELMGPGRTIVTCLCDTGVKYMKRLYSKSELEKRNLIDAVPQEYRQFLKPWN
jgi:cysteine synthase A